MVSIAALLALIELELEGICRESRNARASDLARHRPPTHEGSVGMALVSRIRCYDSFLVCASCLIVYCVLGGLAPGQERVTAISVALTIVELLISIKSSSIAHSRKVWTERWGRLKAEESHLLNRGDD